MDFDKRTEETVNKILKSYEDTKEINEIDIANQPDKKAIIEIIHKLLKILYPGYYSDRIYRQYSLKNNMAATIEDVIFNLNKQIFNVCKYGNVFVELSEDELKEKVADITFAFVDKIPEIREVLEMDIDAFYEGDPAAYSKADILLSYPGLLAISIYRMAHELYLLGVPMMPRIMTEYGHSVKRRIESGGLCDLFSAISPLRLRGHIGGCTIPAEFRRIFRGFILEEEIPLSR